MYFPVPTESAVREGAGVRARFSADEKDFLGRIKNSAPNVRKKIQVIITRKVSAFFISKPEIQERII